ncbi:hypothetical protein QYF36_022499 [Acer negundo]|nr:hypothetical protein QYF36_022499 [Acer negundo]
MVNQNVIDWHKVEALLYSYESSNVAVYTMYGRVCEALGCRELDLVRNLVEDYKGKRARKAERDIRATETMDMFYIDLKELTNTRDEVHKIVKAIKSRTTTSMEALTRLKEYFQ